MRAINAYLVRDADGYVLIDCGLDLPVAWDALLEQLRALGAPLESIHTVVATHAHPDHLGLAHRIRERSGGALWLHAADWEFLRQRYLQPAENRAQWLRWLEQYGVPTTTAQEITRSFGRGQAEIEALAPDRLVAGGEVLEAGPYRLELQWTPGHTPGHVCLYEPAHRLLFTGDHILPNVSANVSPAPFAATNPLPIYLESLDFFAGLPVDLGLPGHGAPMTALGPRLVQLRDHQLHRQEQLQGLLTPRPQTAYELANQLWTGERSLSSDRFPEQFRRNAVGTLIAHLEFLADQGKAQRHEGPVIAFSHR
jgi:glyoxylase-like metal-dependent hydrolase (beta-lactamase superfamily II)